MSKIHKLVVDRNLCIGAGACVAAYAEVFSLDTENKAVMSKREGPPTSDMTNVSELHTEHIDDATLLLAAQSCPTMAITLYDESGKQLFPEL